MLLDKRQAPASRAQQDASLVFLFQREIVRENPGS
jgi:hypothetical protein